MTFDECEVPKSKMSAKRAAIFEYSDKKKLKKETNLKDLENHYYMHFNEITKSALSMCTIIPLGYHPSLLLINFLD